MPFFQSTIHFELQATAWWSARGVCGSFETMNHFFRKFAGPGRLVDLFPNSDASDAPGWLRRGHLQIFLDGRIESLGTELEALLMKVFRMLPGWLSAWRPPFFMGCCAKSPGTEFFALFITMVRAVPGWLLARPFFSLPQDSEALGPRDYHLPVFPAEIGHWMRASAGLSIIDGTVGGGGHSEIFLKAGANVLGVDRDPEALAHSRSRLADFGDRFTTWEGNFCQISEIPAIQEGKRFDGLLLDLGVSSRQLDSAVRGFSFMREGPLDMRMGPSCLRTAAEIVNQWPEADIVRILFEYGEESKARRIAGAIIKQRVVKPFETTLELASCIERAIGRHGRTHPATKTFQAIRMAVNEELESLATALAAASKILKPGGLLLIITFHSLEDRMVKRFFKHRSTAFLDDPAWPEPRPNPEYQFHLLARKSIAPTAAEIASNPRARSAKLRVAQLIA